MKLTKKIEKAINLASQLHAGQLRKGGDSLPYISHPFAVAWILNEYSDNEDVIVAGLLHDVLEDVPGYSYDDLARDFGTEVAEIVRGVSEDKDPNAPGDDRATWLERKEKYLAVLAQGSPDAMMVSAADKIHNLRSMIAAYRQQGEELWASFNSPADKKLWFYEQVLGVVRDRVEPQLVKDLEKELETMRSLMADMSRELFVGFVMSNAYPYEYHAYLVNNSVKHYSRVQSLTGAYCSIDDDLLQTGMGLKERGELPARSYMLIEKGDGDDLDFVIWYDLDLYDSEGVLVERRNFRLPRLWHHNENDITLPILNQPGEIIVLGTRQDASIDESVKTLDLGPKYYKAGGGGE